MRTSWKHQPGCPRIPATKYEWAGTALPAQAREFAQQSHQIYVELKHAKADILSKWIAQHWANSDKG
jgi:hypothetical protein